MSIDELIEIILIVTNNNLEKIAIDDYSFEMDFIKKKDISFIRTFIETYLDYEKEEKMFFELINNDYDKEKATSLGIKLNNTQSKLIDMAKENFRLIQERRQAALDRSFGSKVQGKVDVPQININSAKEAIYSLIWFYHKQLLFNKDNIRLLNDAIGYDFFEEGLEYSTFKRFINLIDEENAAYNAKTKSFKERSFCNQLRILLKKYDMLRKVYRFGDIEQLSMLKLINECLIEEYDKKTNYKNIKRIDLFEGLFGYDNLEKIGFLNAENVKEDKALIEISDLNGMFKNLTNEQIARILYNYLQVYKNVNQIVSENDKYAFKDLSPITEIIERRSKENVNINKIIDDICGGNTHIKFNEKESIKNYNN